jgi:predicted nucleotide-binding protein (sugar kinase/HSP70/actin superfamily)
MSKDLLHIYRGTVSSSRRDCNNKVEYDWGQCSECREDIRKRGKEILAHRKLEHFKKEAFLSQLRRLI